MNDKPQNSETQKNDALENDTSKATPENNSKNNLSCEIVQDLLPSYMDKLTSKKTNEAVERHLDNCKTCTEKMQRMQKTENIANTEIPSREIDFLKTVKKKTKKKIFLSVAAILAMVICLVGLKLFVIGDELSPQEVSCHVGVSASGTVRVYDIFCLSSAKNLTSISYKEEEGGILRITFRGVLASFLSTQDKLQNTYEPQNRLTRIYIGDQIVWDHETNISPCISAVFQARHEFVGDMTANNRSVQALGMKEVLGDFENELLTDEEPYGWKIILKSDVHISDKTMTEMKMKGYAALLLATIDNLEYITYEYNIETYLSGLEPKTMTITVEDAKDEFGLRFYIPVFDENGEYIESVEEPWEEHEWTPADLESVMRQAKLDGSYLW